MNEQGPSKQGTANLPKYLILAMAFGQGAHAMLASDEAVMAAIGLVDQQLGSVLERWTQVAPAATHLVRVAGQLAAWKAASEGKTEIAPEHVAFAFARASAACGC